MVVKHEPEDKAVATCICKLSKAIEIRTGDRCSCLDLDANDTAAAIFNDDVDLVLLFVAEVRELEAAISRLSWLSCQGGSVRTRNRLSNTPTYFCVVTWFMPSEAPMPE